MAAKKSVKDLKVGDLVYSRDELLRYLDEAEALGLAEDNFWFQSENGLQWDYSASVPVRAYHYPLRCVLNEQCFKSSCVK